MNKDKMIPKRAVSANKRQMECIRYAIYHAYTLSTYSNMRTNRARDSILKRPDIKIKTLLLDFSCFVARPKPCVHDAGNREERIDRSYLNNSVNWPMRLSILSPSGSISSIANTKFEGCTKGEWYLARNE